MATPERDVFGWDIGGAHVKVCRSQRGEVVDVVQWACPLWRGMDQLTAVIEAARARWSGLGAAQHAVTMTGEMVDLFANREDGVRRIAAEFEQRLLTGSSTPNALHFYAGDAGWCASAEVATHWEAIASANWLATARHAALSTAKSNHDDGILVDIGSTTTDLITFRGGRVLTTSRTDAQRLASGELVYHGVVRTPLCALAQRIDWRGTPHNVMNEFFATTADAYRLTGELRPEHDLHPSADNAPKDQLATCQRLARMIGLDQRDATPEDWLDFARSWRAAQVAELAGQLRRVMAAHQLNRDAVVVSAGCGDFLVADVLAQARAGGGGESGGQVLAYGCDIARVSAHARPDRRINQAWAQVCAPSVAVAALFDQDHR